VPEVIFGHHWLKAQCVNMGGESNPRNLGAFRPVALLVSSVVCGIDQGGGGRFERRKNGKKGGGKLGRKEFGAVKKVQWATTYGGKGPATA